MLEENATDALVILTETIQLRTRLEAAVPSQIHPSALAPEGFAVRVAPTTVQHQVHPQAARLEARTGGGGEGEGCREGEREKEEGRG